MSVTNEHVQNSRTEHQRKISKNKSKAGSSARHIELLIRTATYGLTTRVTDRDGDKEANTQGQSWNDGKGISLLGLWSLQPDLYPPWTQTRLVQSIKLSVQVTVQIEEGCWGRESVKHAGHWEKFRYLGK